MWTINGNIRHSFSFYPLKHQGSKHLQQLIPAAIISYSISCCFACGSTCTIEMIYNFNQIKGHRPVILKRAVIGSKGRSAKYLSRKEFHDWSIIK